MKKNKMNFSSKIIILMFVEVTVFIVVMVVTFWKFQIVPDVLIEKFFDFFKLEGGALGIIKVAKVIADKIEAKKKGNKKK